jgi:hypothetical protein
MTFESSTIKQVFILQRFPLRLPVTGLNANGNEELKQLGALHR